MLCITGPLWGETVSDQQLLLTKGQYWVMLKVFPYHDSHHAWRYDSFVLNSQCVFVFQVHSFAKHTIHDVSTTGRSTKKKRQLVVKLAKKWVCHVSGYFPWLYYACVVGKSLKTICFCCFGGRHIVCVCTLHDSSALLWCRSSQSVKENKTSGAHLSINILSYQKKDSHVKDKTVSRPSYLWHGNPHTLKRRTLYWDGAQLILV